MDEGTEFEARNTCILAIVPNKKVQVAGSWVGGSINDYSTILRYVENIMITHVINHNIVPTHDVSKFVSEKKSGCNLFAVISMIFVLKKNHRNCGKLITT